MGEFLIRWVILAIAVWAAEYLVPGVDNTGGWQSLLIAALVLGVLNSFVKPLLTIISFPFIIVTFGLFLIVINALLLMLTARLVPGFQVTGFWEAAIASVIVSVVTMVASSYRIPERVT